MGDAVWAVVVAVKVEIFTRYVVAKVGVDDPDLSSTSTASVSPRLSMY